ncbi:hypothetical protein T484DRAFT_1812100 [Baffinella frigidus]|nr:hypothetical protein T484DRAFT_1812100 [Cryptophyta sp. CCMP2293]
MMRDEAAGGPLSPHRRAMRQGRFSQSDGDVMQHILTGEVDDASFDKLLSRKTPSAEDASSARSTADDASSARSPFSSLASFAASATALLTKTTKTKRVAHARVPLEKRVAHDARVPLKKRVAHARVPLEKRVAHARVSTIAKAPLAILEKLVARARVSSLTNTYLGIVPGIANARASILEQHVQIIRQLILGDRDTGSRPE